MIHRTRKARTALVALCAVYLPSVGIACRLHPRDAQATLSGFPDTGLAAGGVVAIPDKKGAALILVCGPRANLGPDYKASRGKQVRSEPSKTWQEVEEVDEADLLLAEINRTTYCQHSIDQRQKMGWAIKTVRRVLWSCAKSGQTVSCRALSADLDLDPAVVVERDCNG